MPALEIMPQVPSTQVETPEQWYISHSSSDACYPHRVVDRASLSPTAPVSPKKQPFFKRIAVPFRFRLRDKQEKRRDQQQQCSAKGNDEAEEVTFNDSLSGGIIHSMTAIQEGGED